MNWEVFTKLSSLQVRAHWITAVLAFVAGIIIFTMKKGTPAHRGTGRIYVVLMVVTCVSAFFVRTIQAGEQYQWWSGFSLIHLLIPLTLYMLARAIFAIRRGDVKSHKNNMIMSFIGALIIAGVFTFIPGRHMYDLFFANEEDIRQRVESGVKK